MHMQILKTERRRIRKNGGSISVVFDRETLKNLYGLKENDEVQIDYNCPKIEISAVTTENVGKKV